MRAYGGSASSRPEPCSARGEISLGTELMRSRPRSFGCRLSFFLASRGTAARRDLAQRSDARPICANPESTAAGGGGHPPYGDPSIDSPERVIADLSAPAGGTSRFPQPPPQIRF